METQQTKEDLGKVWLLEKFRAGAKLTQTDIQWVVDTYDIYPKETVAYYKWLHKNKPEEFGVDGNDNKHQKAEIYLRNNYKLLYNTVTGLQEVTDNRGNPVKKQNIWLEMNKDKIKLSFPELVNTIEALLTEYDPFKDFFKSLPEWDGVDYISQVANCVKTDDDDFWQVMFRKALVRTIECAIGRKVNRSALILISRQQNTGKTMFIRYLNPWGDTKYYCEEKIISGNRDSELLLAQNLIFNLDELQGMDARAMNTIKATISKSVINTRKAYRADHEQIRRRCTFWGSSNLEQYLTDDTGNSRWLGFEIQGTIDWATYNQIPVHYLWTQAYHLWRNGFDGELTAEEAGHRDNRNKDMEQSNNETDICVMLFENSNNFMSNAEILNHYRFYFKDQSDTYKIGRALTKLGFKPSSRFKDNRTVRGYLVDKLEPNFHQPSQSSDSTQLFNTQSSDSTNLNDTNTFNTNNTFTPF